MTPVRLEPAAFRSRVKHSTTEPLALRVLGLLIFIYVNRHLSTIRSLKLGPTVMQHLHPVAFSQRSAIMIAKCASDNLDFE